MVLRESVLSWTTSRCVRNNLVGTTCGATWGCRMANLHFPTRLVGLMEASVLQYAGAWGCGAPPSALAAVAAYWRLLVGLCCRGQRFAASRRPILARPDYNAPCCPQGSRGIRGQLPAPVGQPSPSLAAPGGCGLNLLSSARRWRQERHIYISSSWRQKQGPSLRHAAVFAPPAAFGVLVVSLPAKKIKLIFFHQKYCNIQTSLHF